MMTDDKPVRLAAAEGALTKVLSMTPHHAMAYCPFGVVKIFTKRAAQGITECERGLELDRNLAQTHGWIGLVKCFSGRAEATEAHVQEAFRLSPRDNKTYDWMTILGTAKTTSGTMLRPPRLVDPSKTSGMSPYSRWRRAVRAMISRQ